MCVFMSEEDCAAYKVEKGISRWLCYTAEINSDTVLYTLMNALLKHYIKSKTTFKHVEVHGHNGKARYNAETIMTLLLLFEEDIQDTTRTWNLNVSATNTFNELCLSIMVNNN